MLLTLIFMLKDVAAFCLIMIAYLIASSQITCTFFQDINGDMYGNLWSSFKTSFNIVLGAYDYTGAKD